jgi:hypothetical protein
MWGDLSRLGTPGAIQLNQTNQTFFVISYALDFEGLTTVFNINFITSMF